MDKNKIAAHLAEQVASATAAAPADLEALKLLALAATPGPWEWWTSNSTLRLTGADGKDGGVLHGTAHRGYGDVTCSEKDRAYIAAASPAVVLAMIDRIARAEAPAASGDERAEFENSHPKMDIRHGDDGRYVSGWTQIAWEGWQEACRRAAVSAATKPAALEALRVGQQAVPEGYVIVPRETTAAMVEAYNNTVSTGFAGSPAHATHVWEAMLAAAPALLQEKAAPAEQPDSSHVMPPFAAPASQHHAWLAVADAMPPKDVEVLVYAPNGGDPSIEMDTWGELYECPDPFSTAQICTGEGWASNEFEDITHWMPLPPKPDESAVSGFREGRNTSDKDAAELGSSVAPSAEDVRDAALTEASDIARCHDLGTPDGHAIADAIDALKSAGRGSDDVREGA